MRRTRQYRVSSLVIRQRNLGEADRIVTLYTRERGKLSAVAKSARRTQSRLAGGLQLFCHAQVQLAAGRSLEIATQVQPADLFYHLRDDVRAYSHACYAAELLDALVDEGAPDPPLFELLLETFRGLDGGGDPPTLIRGFELKLLARLGYGPEMVNCVICSTEIGASGAGFSVSQGGVTCGRCARGHGAGSLGAATLKAMREMVQLAPEELARRKLTRSVGEELERILRPFVDYQLARPLRSVEFLRA